MLGDEFKDFDGDAAAGTSASAGIGDCCGAAGGLDCRCMLHVMMAVMAR